jgi:hypothetical protein
LNTETSASFDRLTEELPEGPYSIVDILPEQVPQGAAGRYFAVERFYLKPERLRALRRRFAGIILRLNCYYDMTVSFDGGENREANPDPEMFAQRLADMSGNGFLRVVFEAQRAMIDIGPDDTYMTVYDPASRLADKLEPLARSEGLFVWSPSGKQD